MYHAFPTIEHRPANNDGRSAGKVSIAIVHASEPIACDLLGYEYIETDVVLDATEFRDPADHGPLPSGWYVVEGDHMG